MDEPGFARMLRPEASVDQDALELEDGSKIAVMGGGPAGSFFSIFTLDLAQRMGIDIQIDIYEPRDFTRPGPVGCNMCGGIISESLVQNLSTDGVNLPPAVVQRGIDSYVLHMDVGSVRIDTPLQEKRIGAVYRGSGPRDIKEIKWGSFDGFLQSLAIEKGANIIHSRIKDVEWEREKPFITTRDKQQGLYDLLVVSIGINTNALKIFENLEIGYEPPKTTKTFIREFYLGSETIEKYMGDSMHVFLLDIPRLEFAAIIPKGDYISFCLLGDDIDKDLIDNFLSAPEVKNCLPPDLDLTKGSCQCSPFISISAAKNAVADRIVFIGDSGTTRLYKDGIGAAYRTAKAAASTVIFQGVSKDDFERHYLPACQKITQDNQIGKIVFFITRQIQQRKFARRAMLRMIKAEQVQTGQKRHMSTVLWDTFTGSAPYREIFLRALHPGFLTRFLRDNAIALTGR